MKIKLSISTNLLNSISERLADKSGVLRNLGGFVAREIDENFRQGGRPRWAGNRSLVRTGRMKREAVTVKLDGSKVHVGDGLKAIPYAAWINDGTRKMPARPFMSVPDMARGAVKTIRESLFGRGK